MSSAPLGPVALRRMSVLDLGALTDMWVASWEAVFPDIDFEGRRMWFQDRMSEHLLTGARCIVAEHEGALLGFVTLDEKTSFIDQLAVAPAALGRGVAQVLLAEARRLSPEALVLDVNEANARALNFYKRQGFRVTGDGVSQASGLKLLRMAWRA